MNKTKYSIVIPVYKSSTSLIELTERINTVFKKQPEMDHEIIFVNDSPFHKKTVETLKNLVEKNNTVKVVELMKNYGQQPATICGIEIASGDFIVTMDDDLQRSPEDLPVLMEKSDHDVVIAKFLEKKHSFFKRITSHIKGYFDQIILGKPKDIKLTAFRLINADTARLMFKRKSPYPFITALLFDITDDLVNVDVPHYPRHEGESNYTLFRMVRLFGNLIINNSSFLLRMIGYVGVIVALMTIVMAFVLLFKKIFLGYVLTGWTSIMLLVMFFGGLTLLTLGVMGEYLVRIIATTEERPSYYVRKIHSREKN